MCTASIPEPKGLQSTWPLRGIFASDSHTVDAAQMGIIDHRTTVSHTLKQHLFLLFFRTEYGHIPYSVFCILYITSRIPDILLFEQWIAKFVKRTSFP